MTNQIINSIKNHIKTQLGIESDIYLEQYDNPDNIMWTTPSVFIEFAPVDWIEDKNLKILVASNAQFTLHHVTQTGYDDTQSLTSTEHLTRDAQLRAAFRDFYELSAHTIQGIAFEMFC